MFVPANGIPMARAALYFEGELIKERGLLKRPTKVNSVESWSKAALKTFRRELGELAGSRDCPKKLVKHTIDEHYVRLGYSDGHQILVDRLASPLG